MKLSEAIMLGAVTVKMEPTDWNSCALGAAANAVGIPPNFETQLFGQYEECNDRAERLKEKWPWMRQLSGGDQVRMFSTGGTDYEQHFSEPTDWMDEIWFRFDSFVCEGEMTLEQLVDYVRSIEPSCGRCNRFDCPHENQIPTNPPTVTIEPFLLSAVSD